MKMLALFSNPPDQPALRLDKEDKILSRLAKQFESSVTLVRQHASNIDDIHQLLIDGNFDLVHFSGHGDHHGIYVERRDVDQNELVSPQRLLAYLEMPSRNPQVVMLLCCYSYESLAILANSAPFVITTEGAVEDNACLIFVQGFYEHFFRGNTIQNSFEHAQSLMRVNACDATQFKLSRRQLIIRSNSLFIESTPSNNHGSILINLDKVRDLLNSFGMTEEELCHLIARKLIIHAWIFDGSRESAILPIGHMLFGEFSWQDAHDSIECRRLMKLSADVPAIVWKVWARLLTSYNDLAASEYRHVKVPKDREDLEVLAKAVALFEHHIQRYLTPSQEQLSDKQAGVLVPNIELAIAHVEKANDALQMRRLKQVIINLELALTNYHEVVDALQPPEDKSFVTNQ